MRDAKRVSEALSRKIGDAENLARENGLLRYQRDTAQAAAREAQSLLQRKVVRQARVIRRLEERLRALNAKPYEGAEFETAPGVECDAAQRLPGEEELGR
jgi:hypothetical protein